MNLHLDAVGRYGIGDGELADGAAPEGFALPLSGEESQLLLLVFG